MEDLKKKIKILAANTSNEIISIRRHLHQYPELSFQEYETTKYITEQLKKYQIEVQKQQFGETGVVGIIKGKNHQKKTIALRADIDALPIHEKNTKPYVSQYRGIMHACGHDVHTASLIGVAHLLNQLKEQFEGTVKCIFQPAEEQSPGGAKGMIEKGVLENPKVEQIIALHVDPKIPVGKVEFVAGKASANLDSVYINLKGKGGHVSLPEDTVNPVIMGAYFLKELNEIYEAENDGGVKNIPQSDQNYLLTFGKIIGLGETGIIPDQVQIVGTLRTLDSKVRTNVHKHIQTVAKSIEKKFGGKVEVDIRTGYPSMYNNEALTKQLEEASREFLGNENIVKGVLGMYGEDFAYFQNEIPGCMYNLGVQNKTKGIQSGLHTATFDIDEKALKISVGLMTWLTLKTL